MQKFTGKTLEECLQAASNELKLPIESINYTTREEKSGFLGLGTLVTVEVISLEDVCDFIQTYLEAYFKNIDMPCNVMMRIDGDEIKIMLDAENNAILIGKAGQTLQAINTVLKSAVASQYKRHYNLLVDVNGYKEERYEKVKILADRLARQVVRTKISVTLDPLPNDERKIIHQFLSDYPTIKTESVGEGNQRRLKIIYDEKKLG